MAFLGIEIGGTKLQSELSTWSTDANASQRGVNWQMKVKDARGKLKFLYPQIKS